MMANGNARLIQRFRKGHQAIADVVTQIQRVVRSYGQAKPLLPVLDQVLINHLECQDDELFRELLDFYREDREAVKMLEFLIYELKEFKIQYLVFSDKYPGHMADRGSRNFPKDFAELTKAIVGRLQMENEYFFPLLEKFPGSGCGEMMN